MTATFKFSAAFALLVLTSFYDESMAAESACGDWTPFREDKCFKIFDNVTTFEAAEKICQQQATSGSSLISIRFHEEQEFVSNLFKSHRVVDNVWIGAKYVNRKYRWNGESDMTYTNWAQGHPKNQAQYCAQLQSDEHGFGKWSDVVCSKRNLVACQKLQTWSLAHMQKLLLSTMQNPFPIGFTYVQLPKEKSPTEIWPWMIWKDATADYAGLFFRAEGGGAGEFGKVQAEDSPRLVHVKRRENACNEGCWRNEVDVVKGVLSGGVFSGDAAVKRVNYISLQFLITNAEVRPKNMAIRIWKRAG